MTSVVLPPSGPHEWTACLLDHVSGPASPPTDYKKLKMLFALSSTLLPQEMMFATAQKQFGNSSGLKTLSSLDGLLRKMNQPRERPKADSREDRVDQIEGELKSRNNRVDRIEGELKIQKTHPNR
jgi:hypothetical protein